jgi:hypothetical protein|tara:strand:+ start:1491 stop:1775 length:285 start_codon:yes stop_codon:yes gene_type:complete
MSIVTSRTFISRLNKLFKNNLIELAYVYDDKETILVDGVEIDLMWMPHISKLSDREVISVLYNDCRDSIRRFLKIEAKKQRGYTDERRRNSNPS